MGTRKSLAEKVVPKVVRDGIDRFIAPHLRTRASGKGLCSSKTANERRVNVHSTVAQLWVLGFRIRQLDSLAPKHVKALMDFWGDEGKSPEFLHNRLSTLRTLAGWLGKRHVVGDLEDYFPKERTRRKTATEKNMAWEDNGVDADYIIDLAKTIDERLAVMLALQHYFGLRTKESIEFRPFNALVDEGTHLQVYMGTKGGKPRIVPLKTAREREVYEWSRRVVADGKVKRLRWPDLSWEQAQTRFYHLMDRRLSLTKDKLGVTAHGLRHGWIHRSYKLESGFDAPIKNRPKPYVGEGVVQSPVQMPIPVFSPSVLSVAAVQSKPVPPPGLTRELHQKACMSVSLSVGHNRTDIIAMYGGTYGHAFRTVSSPTTMKPPAEEK